MNLKKGKKMKNFIKSISVLLITLCIGSSVFASNFWSTPRLGGGYNYYGDVSGWSTPRLGGGYNYYGDVNGWSAPRLGGGYNYYFD